MLAAGLAIIAKGPTIERVALTIVAAYATTFALGVWAIGRIIAVQLAEIGDAIRAPFLSALLMAVVLTPLRLFMAPSWLSLAVLAVTGAAVYFAGFLVPDSRFAFDEFRSTARAAFGSISQTVTKPRAKL